MNAVLTPAPAKINWTLEVLGRRPDGYHEVRTVLQTIDLADEVRVRPAAGIELSCSGPVAAALAGLPVERNLAHRAAVLLKERTGHRGGARIEIEKRIPVGAGLGGGSSDAGAVLRALAALWGLGLSPPEMVSLAAELGSDVPFFLAGGTALARGRGEVLERLPDLPPLPLLVAVPPGEAPVDKTARMYALLGEQHFSDGSASERLAARLRAGARPTAGDLYNVFDAVAPRAFPVVSEALAVSRATGVHLHLTGAGRGVFSLRREAAGGAAPVLSKAGWTVIDASTLPAGAAVALRPETAEA